MGRRLVTEPRQIAWLVYLRRSPRTRGLATGLAVFVLVQFVAWWRLIPAPGLLYFAIAGTYGIVYFLPYVAHRFIAPRLSGMAATLVLPMAWVAVELVFHRWAGSASRTGGVPPQRPRR